MPHPRAASNCQMIDHLGLLLASLVVTGATEVPGEVCAARPATVRCRPPRRMCARARGARSPCTATPPRHAAPSGARRARDTGCSRRRRRAATRCTASRRPTPPPATTARWRGSRCSSSEPLLRHGEELRHTCGRPNQMHDEKHRRGRRAAHDIPTTRQGDAASRGCGPVSLHHGSLNS